MTEGSKTFLKRFINLTIKSTLRPMVCGTNTDLLDDMVAYAVKSNGGFVWACKNYDGDV